MCTSHPPHARVCKVGNAGRRPTAHSADAPEEVGRVTLIDRYHFGDRDHLALRMPECIALTPDEKHFADNDEEPTVEDIRTVAQAYLDAGYEIVPLLPGTKEIHDAGWPDRPYTIDSVNRNSNL